MHISTFFIAFIAFFIALKKNPFYFVYFLMQLVFLSTANATATRRSHAIRPCPERGLKEPQPQPHPQPQPQTAQHTKTERESYI